MTKSIFVNLPVADVATATAFYTALGFERNPTFSDDHKASSMVWSDAITVMLLHRDFYATFTDKEIIDAHRQSGALLCLSFDDRATVDAFAKAAMGAGGSELHGAEDHGFMYSRAVADPDGHGWQAMTMDMAAFEAMKAAPAAA
ncbi:VOC family protein [Sphingomonas sp.]|uniref:VOC family protein n=1 Tax=Sphingomonas sp. TaxID=28214 RepID=UPI003B000876